MVLAEQVSSSILLVSRMEWGKEPGIRVGIIDPASILAKSEEQVFFVSVKG